MRENDVHFLQHSTNTLLNSNSLAIEPYFLTENNLHFGLRYFFFR